MGTIRIAFFDAKPYDRRGFHDANVRYQTEIKYFETHLDEDTASLAEGFEVVCVFVNDRISKRVIDILVKGGTKLIALRCAGYNNVDIAATKGRIRVCRVPEYSPHAVAEHTVGLMLSLNRRIHKAYARSKEHNFSINGLMGTDFHGKTAGIIGTGKIGRCVVRILRGMGMNVLAYDIAADDAFAAKYQVAYVELSELLMQSDAILLHCPLTAKTRYIISDTTIDQMKNGVMLINTGRGALIQTTALVEGLKRGKIGSAALDVYEEEEAYFFEDRSEEIIDDELLARLLTFPNVLVTSHQGFFTREAMNNIAETTLKNISDFFTHGQLPDEVA
jgi:D-lactate dehydrogenase